MDVLQDPGTARSRPEPAQPRRRFFRAPHRRVAAVVTASIVVACAVVVVTVVELGTVRAPLQRADRSLRGPSSALQASAAALSDMTPTYLDALGRPAAERSLLMASLADDNSRYQAAFDRYERGAVGIPGEKALQRKFHAAAKASGDISVALLAPEELTAAQVVQAMSYNAALTNTLDELRSMYAQRTRAETAAAVDAGQTTHDLLVFSSAVVLVLVAGAAVWLIVWLRRQGRAVDAQAARNELEAQLQRALGMAESEDDTFATVHAAITAVAPRRGVELLIADSSRAHLHQVLAQRIPVSGGCPVGSPNSCPAAVHGQTQRFARSDAIDACPHLRSRDGEPVAATCVPVTITGRPMGVLHAVAPTSDPLRDDTVDAFELIARRAGERISMLRTFARSEMQAHTDPLTGLLNRRSIENSAQELVESGDSYAVAYADLDHFKKLNDVHGHDMGDRALRLFAHVLRDSIRPADLPARYGGEEFLIVLPQCTPEDARAVMERVRTNLRAAVRDAGSPEFSVSVGIAGSSMTKTFSEVAEEADSALLAAKAAGRDRVIIHGAHPLVVPDDPSGLTDA